VSVPENPFSALPPLPESPIPASPLPVTAPPDEDPPWNFWDVLGLTVIALVAMFACVLGAAYFVHERFTPATPYVESLKRPEVIVGGQLLAYILVLLVMYRMVSTQTDGRVLAAMRWNWPRSWGSYLLAGIALELCLVPFAFLLPMPKHAPIDDFFRTARDAYVLSLFGVFFAPLFEEIFFRGFLYPVLARRLRMIPAIVLTALAFASIHASQLKYSWGPVLVIFLVGIALTTVRAVKKSLGATVLMHMAYNGAIFIAAYLATDGFRHLEKFNQ
jgi:membrane protease YdiL (CAAX protease family)